MDNEILYIKNMVCDRCILTVENILSELDIPAENISLGKVTLSAPITVEKKDLLQKELQPVGFEMLVVKNERLSNRIKSIIINAIYGDKNLSDKNLSVILSEQLHMDYSHLSSLFSKIEGKSIQHFQQEIKTERVKELLEYDELSISEIANEMGYSSAAYLATQFKKSTGFTPSVFRLQHQKRNSLDKL